MVENDGDGKIRRLVRWCAAPVARLFLVLVSNEFKSTAASGSTKSVATTRLLAERRGDPEDDSNVGARGFPTRVIAVFTLLSPVRRLE